MTQRPFLRAVCLLCLWGIPAWSENVESIGEVRRWAVAHQDQTRPCRVRGVVTLPPGTLVTNRVRFYVQDQSGGISVRSESADGLAAGDEAEVTGTCYLRTDGQPGIRAASMRSLRRGRTPEPQWVSAGELVNGAYAAQLVRVRGVVAERKIGESMDTLTLNEGRLQAYVRRPAESTSFMARTATVGTEVVVTGIVVPQNRQRYRLRLRGDFDLVALRPQGRFSAGEIAGGMGLLAVIAGAVAVWIVALRRAVAGQTGKIRQLLEEARESSRLKSEFLANMSHEIRTPLNGILGMQALAMNTDLDAQQRDLVATAQHSAEQLLLVLNDILDFSKIEANRIDLAREPFSPLEVMEGSVAALAAPAAEKSLPVETRIGPDVPGRALGDPARLRQILLNLLSNAIKFTESGRIELAVAVDSDRGEWVDLHFSVADTGIGIPAEQQAHVFEAFRQVDGSSTRRHGGTGLGLAISSRLAELMGGRLWLESGPGRGSVFHFTVPLERAACSAPEGAGQDGAAVEVLRPASRALRILLAEDNPVNQKLCLRLIEKLGHSVALAVDGRQALARHASGRFDLLLMDVQMPEMDGLEATREIRSREKASGAHTPILGLTAYAMKGDRERCLEAGMDDYLSKPVRIEDLARAIDALTPLSVSWGVGRVSERREPGR